MMYTEKIARLSWAFVDSIKDTVNKNLLTAINDRLINIDPAVASALVALITASIEEGYHKCFKNVMKSVVNVVDEEIAYGDAVKRVKRAKKSDVVV